MVCLDTNRFTERNIDIGVISKCFSVTNILGSKIKSWASDKWEIIIQNV